MGNTTIGSGLGLDLPSWATRIPDEDREQTSKFSTNFRQTKSDLANEMRRMDVDEWTLEDVTGSGGFPGVVVRWQKDGANYGVACDRYTAKRNNLREVYLWIKETRKRADRPVDTGADEFAAAQLPPADEDAITAPPAAAGKGLDEEPHEILEVSPDASADVVRAVARRKLANAHPDGDDGDREEYNRIQKAKEAMVGE